MICPKWVKTRSQPIAVRDVLAYLVGCLDIPIEAGGEVYDIGGPEILTYREMMLRFAANLGLKRYIIDVPVLTPRLSAYWVNLMTPVPAGIAFPLIEGLKSETICEDDRIRRLIPFEPIGFDEAVRRAHGPHPPQRGDDPMDQRQHPASSDPRSISTRPRSRSGMSR